MKKVPIVAIVGRANVGKSSIFNAILHSRENIVAREEGTTRDSVMSKVSYHNQDFWLVDTAGLKDAADEFEATIQDQIRQAVDSADLIWVVIEAGSLISQEDRSVAALALKSRKPVFLLVNKADQVSRPDTIDYQKLGIKPIFLTSVTQNRGFDQVLNELIKVIPKTRVQEATDLIKVAVIGRPNVGKSNLFNTLLKKQQAIVSARAGTTRDINRHNIKYEGRTIQLIDTAGIRRSGKIERGVEHFSVIRTLAAIEEADIMLLLMDVEELNVQLDQKIAGLVKEATKGLILVVSKWDKYEDKTSFSHDTLVPSIKHNFEFVPWAPLIFVSSVTGQNVARLLSLVLEISQSREQKIKTTALNRWLAETIAKHPPAGLKNRSPKLNYIVQEQDNPSPNFKVYGAHTKFLHWSYKRFMESELRDKFGFEGTALKFWFFEKHPPRQKTDKVNTKR